jgi:protein arginine kinase activator
MIMLCQNCNERQATVHFVKVINGVRAEMHLCEKCAPLAQKEIPSIDSFDITVSDIINSFFGGNAIMPSAKCGFCNTTFDIFSQTGKLGCPQCYDVFADQLANPIKRIHGSDRHIGKIPKRKGGADKITTLKQKLEEAVAAEDYENAAKIRDEIRKLEGGKSK